MKKPYRYWFLFFSLLCVCAAFFFGNDINQVHFSQDGSLEKTETAAFHLPASLRSIEDEAFMGTASEAVYLPEAVTNIGSRAFADMQTLRSISIPPNTLSIEADAFSGVPALRIYGAAGSYAEKWAENHGYSFIRKDLWIHPGNGAWTVTLCFVLLSALALLAKGAVSGKMIKALCRRMRQGKSMRRKERAELHAQDGYFP